MYETIDDLRKFEFLPVGRLIDDDLELMLAAREPLNPNIGWVPTYRFDMRCSRRYAGSISLRIANTEDIVMYLGHIGYNVDVQFRGRHFAARSCGLVFPLARQHGINPVWITCNPDNWASRRSCELAGGELVEIVDVPPNNSLYHRGDYQKCRYKINLTGL
jgi:tagatose 1,6-diphosphate aldolase